MRIDITFQLLGSARLVRLRDSDNVAPRRFTAKFERDADGVAYVLDVELGSDGHSRCRRIEADGVDGVPTSTNVAHLLRLATAAAAGTGTVSRSAGDRSWQINPAAPDEADRAWKEQIRRTPTRRRDAPGDERLRKVAGVWIESGGDIAAVAHECSVSQATAYRDLDKARRQAERLGLDLAAPLTPSPGLTFPLGSEAVPLPKPP